MTLLLLLVRCFISQSTVLGTMFFIIYLNKYFSFYHQTRVSCSPMIHLYFCQILIVCHSQVKLNPYKTKSWIIPRRRNNTLNKFVKLIGIHIDKILNFTTWKFEILILALCHSHLIYRSSIWRNLSDLIFKNSYDCRFKSSYYAFSFIFI